MKFKRFNINEFLFLNDIENYTGRLNFFHNDNIVKSGVFSKYCIGITYERIWNIKKRRFEIEKCLFKNLNKTVKDKRDYVGKPYYNTYIYDINVDTVERNSVYSYYRINRIDNFGVYGKKVLDKINTLKNECEKIKNNMDTLKKRRTEIKNIMELNSEMKDIKSSLSKFKGEYGWLNGQLSTLLGNYIEESNVINREETINYFLETTDKYFLFNDELYYIDTSKDPYQYTKEQLEILLKESIYKNNIKFDKLKKQIDIFEKITLDTNDGRKREPISDEVKFEVWRRDEGKCVICGSNEKLEFDHIIPFSKGGSNTARNLQLLCEYCNRKKSDKI